MKAKPKRVLDILYRDAKKLRKDLGISSLRKNAQGMKKMRELNDISVGIINQSRIWNYLLARFCAIKERTFIDSLEHLLISHSKCFREDLRLLLFLCRHRLCRKRHINQILRTMTEQTIEFLYLLQKPELIPDYFGLNSPWLDDVDTGEVPNAPQKLFFNLRKTCGLRRTRNGKPNGKPVAKMDVAKMATYIGEDEQKTNDDISLYAIYRVLSDECHNAYFADSAEQEFSMLEEEPEEYPLCNDQYIYLNYVIDRFWNGYLNAVQQVFHLGRT